MKFYTTLYILSLWLLTACADGAWLAPDVVDQVTADDAPGRVSLTLSCRPSVLFDMTADDAALAEGATRGGTNPSPLYANVIHTLFVMQFDVDGVRVSCTPLETIAGSQISVSKEVSLQTSGGQDHTLFVLCNFNDEEWTKLEEDAITLNRFRQMTFHVEQLREGSAHNDDSYLRSLGSYIGPISSDSESLDVLLGRYVARVSIELALADASQPYYVTSVALKNAPRLLPYYQVEQPSEFPSLDDASFFTEDEMCDECHLLVTSTAITAAATRYFYVAENLSTDAARQVRVVITGRRGSASGAEVRAEVPLTSNGYVNRNFNYELLLKLQ